MKPKYVIEVPERHRHGNTKYEFNQHACGIINPQEIERWLNT